MLKTIQSIIFVLAVTSFQAQNWGNGEKVTGNGNVITENRSTGSFDGIGVGGSFDVVLVKGKEGNILLEGESNILPYIETTVENNTLQIKYKKNTNIKTTKKLVVTVSFESIDKVSLGGSGNVSSSEVIKGTNFSANIGGSGNIDFEIDVNEVSTSIGGSGSILLKGKAKELKSSIAGSGNVKAYDLKVDEIDASIAGSGNIQGTVSTRIKARIVGSGSIYYKGNPKYIESKTLGSGNIYNKN